MENIEGGASIEGSTIEGASLEGLTLQSTAEPQAEVKPEVMQEEVIAPEAETIEEAPVEAEAPAADEVPAAETPKAEAAEDAPKAAEDTPKQEAPTEEVSPEPKEVSPEPAEDDAKQEPKPAEPDLPGEPDLTKISAGTFPAGLFAEVPADAAKRFLLSRAGVPLSHSVHAELADVGLAWQPAKAYGELMEADVARLPRVFPAADYDGPLLSIADWLIAIDAAKQ